MVKIPINGPRNEPIAILIRADRRHFERLPCGEHQDSGKHKQPEIMVKGNQFGTEFFDINLYTIEGCAGSQQGINKYNHCAWDKHFLY
jgi:hypothetical protein